MNIDAIRNHPYAQRSIQAGEMHQAILEASYGGCNTRYGDMVATAREKHGAAAALFILLGKFNQQVCNGGHQQYYDNGYTGAENRTYNPTLPLHQEMIKLFREYKLALLPHGPEVLNILESFSVEIDTDRSSTETCSCGGRDEECEECDGTGEVTMDNPEFGGISNQSDLDALDTRYYAINEVWEAEMEAHVKAWFAAAKDPFEGIAAPDCPSVPKVPRKPKLKLVGEDGNAYVILGRAHQALKEAGFSAEQIQEYDTKAKSGNYDHLLATTMEFCEVY
jgi:hypothetical protein